MGKVKANFKRELRLSELFLLYGTINKLDNADVRYIREEIVKLENKIKDKQDEIYILKKDYDFFKKEYSRLIKVGNYQLEEERKRVCELIREQFLYRVGTKEFADVGVVSAIYLEEYLKKIERYEV